MKSLKWMEVNVLTTTSKPRKCVCVYVLKEEGRSPPVQRSTDPLSSAYLLTSWGVFLCECSYLCFWVCACLLDTGQRKINGINLQRQWCELRQSAAHREPRFALIYSTHIYRPTHPLSPPQNHTLPLLAFSDNISSKFMRHSGVSRITYSLFLSCSW